MNTLLCCCGWTAFLEKLPCTLVWITGIIACIFLMKYLFHWIEFLTEHRQHRKMASEKDERERWWMLQNEIKKDWNAVLGEKIKEREASCQKQVEEKAKKECQEELEKRILQVEHDWYKKLLEDIGNLGLDFNKKKELSNDDRTNL